MKKFIGLFVGALVGALLPVTSAMAAPTISFLNPTPLTATQIPELSDKGHPVHLVATVTDIPSNPLVEFQITGTPNTLTAPYSETIDAVGRVGTDTWEAFWTIPDGFADGTYTLSVRLFSNLEQVDEDEQTVTVNQHPIPPPAAADTVELTLPENGGQFGFFTPKGKRPNAIVLAQASTGTDQVRVLYTLTSPGQRPEWTQCGTGSVGEGGSVRVRCTLAEGTNPVAVRAIAAVANQTPPGTPADPALDDTPDAHRIQPYIQVPTSVSFNQSSIRATAGECQLVVANVSDQLGRVVAVANVDVHAQGPNDQLTFATADTTPLFNDTDDYQAPEGHVGSKRTIQCSDESQSDINQGVHRLIGTPDRMHIESVSGSDNTGSFTFALYAPTAGPTNVTVWADTNDDDAQSVSEASGQAQLGWDQDPPPAQREIFIDPDTATAEVGACQSLTLVVRQSGTPVASQNVDIHITGPDTTTAFCSSPGSNASRRSPDQGGHIGDSHPDSDARHAEGETDTSGRFVFGVTSLSDGRVNVAAWIDETEDDVQAASEPVTSADVTFSVDGDRSVSLDASRKRVRKGRRVKLSGSISGSSACEANQVVKLKARRPNARWRNIAKKRTTSEGNYGFRPRVYKTKDYRVIAPKNGPCEGARSRVVRVRARR